MIKDWYAALYFFQGIKMRLRSYHNGGVLDHGVPPYRSDGAVTNRSIPHGGPAVRQRCVVGIRKC